MAYPNTLTEKKEASYVSLSNDIASEDPATANHAKRMIIARKMASFNADFDRYVSVDLWSQPYDDTTLYATVKSRISALITNLVSLGFGG
jgi:hypothetical protein